MSKAIIEKQKVLVGMSGGVDSSLCALLLQEQGYEPVGVTMKIWPQSCFNDRERDNACCGPKAVMDARSVAGTLDVPYYVMNHQKEFEQIVIKNFIEEYSKGRTPIPCVHCNKDLKFGSFFQKAKALGIHKVATGHFARVEYRNGRYLLKQPKDLRKDQTYYLFSLSQEQLSHVLFPIGELTKEEVRAKAKKYNLKTHDKPESQEICFVTDNKYMNFLKERQIKMVPGPILDKKGNPIGTHNGIQNFTIGQRKGLGALGRPVYVIELRPEENAVIVGDQHDLMEREFWISDPNWILFDELVKPVQAVAKIRSMHSGALATIYPGILGEHGGKVRVVFEEPQKAITPGQAAVFYQNDVVVGGGWIEKC